MPAILKQRNTDYLGCYSTVKALTLVPVHSNASDITGTDEEGMSWTKSCREVAAAAGRRFKSSRPDVASSIGKLGYLDGKQG
jgi:hypothetical protein